MLLGWMYSPKKHLKLTFCCGRLFENKIDYMKKLHLFGLTIITLIVAALLNTPAFFVGITKATKIQMIILIIFLIFIALSAVLRIFMNWACIPTWIPVLFGVILFMTSGYMFFYNTDYFLYAINMPMPYWHRVSFYTLPAISLESAIVTGFEYIMDTVKKITPSEKKFITTLFFLYTMMTMTVNFLAIGKLIDVYLHITITHIVIVSCIGISIAVMIKKRVNN